MKLKNLWMLMLLTVGMTSCKYDDSELKDDVRKLEERISAMENTVKQMNADIVSIQGIVSSLEKNVYVEKVEERADGYTLHFTDGTSVSISNGKDGADGSNGQSVPVVGIAQKDGVYYWTLTTDGTTSWLTDADGNPLRVTGAEGTSGITPQLQIDSKGYWTVSYDNGKTFSQVLNADGDPVSALGEKGDKGDTGSAGSTGGTGSAGDSFFKSVVENEDAIVLTLTDGKVISIPKVKPFAIVFSQNTQNIAIGNEELTLSYTITGADESTFVEVYALNGLTAVHNPISLSEGVIKVKATEEVATGSKVIVLLCNKERTITTVLTFIWKVPEVDSTLENYGKEEGTWNE